MNILAPRNTPRSDEVCVVSLQMQHDSGSSEDVGGTQARGVFLTCIPGLSVNVDVLRHGGEFQLSNKVNFVPETPAPVFGNVQVPQGFGRGGTPLGL